MSSKQRHEYELKFKVGSDLKSISLVRQKLQVAGFMSGVGSIETDYLPDTPDDACKKARILLRFRQVESTTSHELLLTLKVKQADKGLLHFREFETNLYSPAPPIIKTINDLLQAHVQLTLNDAILEVRTLDEAKEAVKSIGLTKHRILLSKYRENFSCNENNATIDYFPDGMGMYVEFESHTAEALRQSIERSGFDITRGIQTDYGDLLKLHKISLRDQAQRTALFTKSESALLLTFIR